MNKTWKIRYHGWIITHDAYGTLACYREAGDSIIWCYFGCSLDVIKREIDLREYYAEV